MERWEAVEKLFSYNPNIDRYVCSICWKQFKSVEGTSRHIDNLHNTEVNRLRDKAIIDEIL